MKLKVISFSHSYEYQEYGFKRWNGTKLEGELSENEDPMQAYLELKKISDALKSATIDTLEETRGTHVRDVVEEPVDEVKTTLEAISNCTTMDELNGYWLISKGNLTYSQAYKEREKQLKNEK